MRGLGNLNEKRLFLIIFRCVISDIGNIDNIIGIEKIVIENNIAIS